MNCIPDLQEPVKDDRTLVPKESSSKESSTTVPSPVVSVIPQKFDSRFLEHENYNHRSFQDKIEEINTENIDQSEETKKEEIPTELLKYYKMCQVGVPLNAVKSKMKLEGFDPNLLKLP